MHLLSKRIRLSMDEMPNKDLALVAKKCGLDVATKLILHLQGVSIHVPQKALKKVADKYIRENYDGHNAKELAVVCGVCVRHVYGVVGEGPKKKAAARKPVKKPEKKPMKRPARSAAIRSR